MNDITNLVIRKKLVFGDENLINIQRAYQRQHEEKEKRAKLITEGKLNKKKYRVSYEISYYDIDTIEAYCEDEAREIAESNKDDIIDYHVDIHVTQIKENNNKILGAT